MGAQIRSLETLQGDEDDIPDLEDIPDSDDNDSSPSEPREIVSADVFFHYGPYFITVFKFIRDRFSRLVTVSVQTHPLISDTTNGESPVVSNLAATAAAEPYQYYDSPQNSRVEELWGNSSM
ncbi:hypothetical protein MVEN_00014700 [Mycena venus]|uniref:Uncharacterized protein n=1 Tax=Mycena venus TaxID=2733690 RepID=A0A8H7DGQ1_9AGAR|nr:hypothetical protein MVEN_00014700 [Mycena venus]